MSEHGTDTPMTTPARCTRTDPHPEHKLGAVETEGRVWFDECPGVEPPADVAATPDSRLDVVAPLVHARVWDFDESRDAARDILGALDDLAAAQTMHEPDPDPTGLTVPCHGCDDPSVHTAHLAPGALDRLAAPAPAGLTPAQEIRLRLAEKAMSIADKSTSDDPEATEEDFVRVVSGVVLPIAAMVEHGRDETPALRVHADELRRWKAAEARADLAEARLGHIADALRDLDGRPHEVLGHREMLTLVNAIRDALAWTPDDTTTETQVGVPFRFAAALETDGHGGMVRPKVRQRFLRLFGPGESEAE